MDANQSARKINSVIAPILKANGFTRKGSKWWKRNEITTFFVTRKNARWFNPSSFCIIIGVCFRCIPNYRIRKWNEYLPPDESECHFTRTLKDSTESCEGQRHIWSISDGEENLEPVLQDVKRAISNDALVWFEKLSTLQGAYEVMHNRDAEFFGTSGWGRKDSPMYHFLLGSISMNMGMKLLSIKCFEKLLELDENTFYDFQTLIRDDYRKLKRELEE